MNKSLLSKVSLFYCNKNLFSSSANIYDYFKGYHNLFLSDLGVKPSTSFNILFSISKTTESSVASKPNGE